MKVTNFSGSKTDTGVITVGSDDINGGFTGIALATEGAVGECTVTVVPVGCTTARNPGADGENVIAENGILMIDANLPLESVIITPTNTGTEFTVSWNQY